MAGEASRLRFCRLRAWGRAHAAGRRLRRPPGVARRPRARRWKGMCCDGCCCDGCRGDGCCGVLQRLLLLPRLSGDDLSACELGLVAHAMISRCACAQRGGERLRRGSTFICTISCARQHGQARAGGRAGRRPCCRGREGSGSTESKAAGMPWCPAGGRALPCGKKHRIRRPTGGRRVHAARRRTWILLPGGRPGGGTPFRSRRRRPTSAGRRGIRARPLPRVRTTIGSKLRSNW